MRLGSFVVALRAVWAFALAALLLLAPQDARADDAEDRARGHFKKGIALYDGPPPSYDAALSEFRAAYAEKPIPSLKRNIALCLRALKREVEAIDTLEEMLTEGGTSIKPEVRDAAKKAIAEMSQQIATVRLRITMPVGSPTPYEVALDGLVIASEKASRPLRVAPGEHTFVARARGYNDGLARVTLVAGQHDVPAQIELTPSSLRGRLHVRSTVRTATIALDGVPIAQGEWEGELSAGGHHVEVTAAGVSAWGRDVTVIPAQTTDVDARPGEVLALAAPPPMLVPKRVVPRVHKWLFTLGLSVHEGTRVLNPAAFFERAPTKRGFWGAGVVIKGARKLGPVVLLEAWNEFGAMTPNSYSTNGGAPADVGVAYFELGPALRLRSKGTTFRAIGGVAAGLEIESVTARVKDFGLVDRRQTGVGVSGCFLFEAGFQLFVSQRVFFELEGFYNIYGVGAAKANGVNRFFLESPETRGGARLLVGIEL